MDSDFVRITKVWETVNIMHACNLWSIYIFLDTTHVNIYIIFKRLTCLLKSWNNARKIKFEIYVYCRICIFDDKVDYCRICKFDYWRICIFDDKVDFCRTCIFDNKVDYCGICIFDDKLDYCRICILDDKVDYCRIWLFDDKVNYCWICIYDD